MAARRVVRYRGAMRTGTTRNRRKRTIARTGFSGSGLATGVATQIDVLSAWYGAMGLTLPPPGCTVLGVYYNFTLCWTTASAAGALDHQAVWGFLVNPTTIDTADQDPVLFRNLNWMEYGDISVNSGASVTVGSTSIPSEIFPKHIRAKRKLDGINETLWWIMNGLQPAGTFSFAGQASAVLALP